MGKQARSAAPVACGIAVVGALTAMRKGARSTRLVVAVLDNGALLVAARQALAHDFAFQDATLFNGDVLRGRGGVAAACQVTATAWALVGAARAS